MSRARDIADLGQDKSTLSSYVSTGVTSSEFDTLDGITSTTAELNKLGGVTADATDLNRLDISTEGTSQASKVVTADSSGHVTLAGELRGPATLVIDPAVVGNNTGLLQVKGNLQVDGTTTTINSTTVEVDDKNIVLGSGASDSASADGAGITIDGASATMTYTHSTTSFDFNKPVNVTGNASVSGDLTVDTNTLKVDSSNNRVGIKQTGPASLLTVGSVADNNSANTPLGKVGQDPAILINNSSHVNSESQLLFGYNSGSETYAPVAISYKNTSASSKGKGHLLFATRDATTDSAPSERMRIDSSGNVGIATGSNTLTEKLRVDGAVAITGQLQSHQTSAMALHQTSSTISEIRVYGADASTAGTFRIRGYANDGSPFYEGLAIDSSGNCGIGASSLTGGNVKLDLLNTGSGVGTQIRLKNDHNTGFYIGQAGDTSGDVIVWNDANTNMQFRTNGDKRMNILADGRIVNFEYLRTCSTTEGVSGMQQWVYSATISGTHFELGRVSMQYDNVSYIMFIHNEYGSWNSLCIQGTHGYGTYTYDSVAGTKRVEVGSNTNGVLMNSETYRPAIFLTRQSGYTSGDMTVRLLMICFSRSTINNVASGGDDIWDNTNMTRIQ